ncbi:MAG: ribulose-phosphate 3-epimerase [Campylobacterales bacterium]
MVQIAPSILSADFSRLGEELKGIEEGGADLVHCDVMDGHFVPNLTIGPVVLEGVKRSTSLPLDIHLMVENNPFFVELFAPLKPRYISFHWEEEKHPHRLVQRIKELGIGAGIAINPATPVSFLKEILPELEFVLIMSVNPGFGGQKFITSGVQKVRELREMASQLNPALKIEVDGGVNRETAPLLRRAGADILVAGSFIFKSSNYREAISTLRGEG